jgi:hypothetical protein
MKPGRKSVGYRGALSQGGRLVAIRRAAVAQPLATAQGLSLIHWASLSWPAQKKPSCVPTWLDAGARAFLGPVLRCVGMKIGRPKELRYQPGIFACNRALGRIRKFQDLARQHIRASGEVTLARPLAELLPKGTPAERQQKALVAEINKLIPLVAGDLHRGRLVPLIAWTERKKEFDEAFRQKLVKRDEQAHLILDYFYLHDHDTVGFQESLMGALDQGIGVFENYRRVSIWRKVNPISWLGFVLSIPVRALIEAGLISPERDEDTTMLKWILGLVQTAWVALIGYIVKVGGDHHLLERIWHRIFG